MNSRRDFLRKSAIGGIGLGAGMATLPAFGEARDAMQLTILHTNDMHSRIEPFPDDGRRHGGLGGMARRVTIIEKIRAENEHVLLLDAGDIFQGTPYFNYYQGELEYKLMSKMQYDGATLGNHDFDLGLENLDTQLPHASFPFIISNYNFSNTILKDRFLPYKIFRKGALKIGVFGLGIALKGLVPDNLFGNTRYEDPIGVGNEMVQTLQNEGCHIIICLSHLGYKYESDKVDDHDIAMKVPGLDLIIGGHTHTFLERPTVVTTSENKEVLINQVGWAGVNLGRIDYTFQRNLKKNAVKTAVLKVF